jgi:hypothetical protein
MFCLSPTTVRRYLQKGSEFGWCNYTTANSQEIGATKRVHPVVMINENNDVVYYFNSANKQLEQIKVVTGKELVGSQISIACQTHKPYKGVNFRYADEYLPKEIIDEIKLKDNSEELFFLMLKTNKGLNI